MRPLSALLVALLFVSAAVAPAAGWSASATQQQTAAPPAPRVATIENTTNHLTIPDTEVRTSSFNESGIDVGTAVAAGSTSLHQRHEAAAFESRFGRLDSEFERTQHIRRALSSIETEEAELDRRQQTAIRRYANGEITATEFLRARSMVDTESRELAQRLNRVKSTAEIAPDYSTSDRMTTRMNNIFGNLRTLQGPVGEQLTESMSGAGGADVVYLESSTDAYMLATIDGSQYVRETRLGSQRASNRTDAFAEADGDRLVAAVERGRELYPWTYQRQLPSVNAYGDTGIYRLAAQTSNGQLTFFLDGGTTNVFYELQHRDLNSVRTTDTETAFEDGLRVTIDQSYETGPLVMSVVEEESSEPVDGTVEINGQTVGRTGSNGHLWTVQPRGSYTINVTTENGTEVSVPVVPE
ncbi:DUF7096 domain-containing protein [Haloarcula nitratireducens]|uniref:Uncharacterized protein n=1 Tax=Haloarcula nitratireducens TaxID=2487749 RepID=A0AAW4PFC2_9EURY|nr:hypothetical protein [Halomicroarcula nitratireducens]MBX0296328.1 hypothetical protein [Halomicroarcula nitratireducens]